MRAAQTAYLALLLAASAALARAKNAWWQSAVIYHVYPRSFQDSNGDGVGDLNGATAAYMSTGVAQKLRYVHGLGAGALRLAPIFRLGRSGCEETGVADFRAVDPALGTGDDFEHLLRRAKEMGLRVILDVEPNHSSTEHEWFKQSVKRVEPYTDFYVWKDGKPRADNRTMPPDLPNNWISTLGGSAWEWSAERRQFYLHQFSTWQPDLNYRNPNVIEKLKGVLKFWLEKGVDGFSMNGISYLLEDSRFLDEPLSYDHQFSATEYGYLNHIYTKNVNATYTLVEQWRRTLDMMAHKTDRTPRLLMVGIDSDVEYAMKYYGNATSHGANFPINTLFFTELSNQSRAMDYSRVIHQWNVYMHEGRWPNWMLGNPDVSRAASRVTPLLTDGLHMMLLLLPGTALSYSGEELGMVDHEALSWNTSAGLRSCPADPRLWGTQIAKYRARTPFQWDSSTSAGFSTNTTTWLQVNPNYMTLNLHQQIVASSSHYQVYRRLVAMRQETAVRRGQLAMHVLSDAVFSFARTSQDKDTFVVVINFGPNTVEVSLKPHNLPKVVLVHTASVNSKYRMSDRVHSKKLELQPYSSVVLTTGKVHEYKYSSAASSTAPFVVFYTLGILSISINSYAY